MSFDTSIDINGAEYDIRVEYNYYPRIPGKRDMGLQMEPDEPATIDILKVEINYNDLKNPNWHSIVLPDNVYEDIEAEILEHY